MATYPKPFLSPSDLVVKLQSKGMVVSSPSDAEKAIREIGYYRLKGYFFFMIDPSTGNYLPNTNFEDALKRYEFDVKLSRMLFDYLLKIEVSIRARLVEAFRITGEPLVLNDPSFFREKKEYWDNTASIASEIKRSSDAFIYHNYSTHDGLIPVWAAVEVLSYGTLSKIIKNMKNQSGASFSVLVNDYQFQNSHGSMTVPSQDMFSSWTYTSSTLRNACAHGGRLYRRRFSIRPQIIDSDTFTPATPQTSDLYAGILSMKYLRPDDASWTAFSTGLKGLIAAYLPVIDINDLSFPADWMSHI